jgi:hypothetical protein
VQVGAVREAAVAQIWREWRELAASVSNVSTAMT